MPQAKLVEYLRPSSALLSASTEEGFDYPVPEAKAEGTPTLISGYSSSTANFIRTHRCFFQWMMMVVPLADAI